MICAVSTFLLMIKDDHFISSLLKIALKIDDTLNFIYSAQPNICRFAFVHPEFQIGN